MSLTINNFFRYYFLHPNAKELKTCSKIVANVARIFLSVITVGIVPLICMALYNRKFRIQSPSDQPKITAVATNILNKVEEPKEDKKSPKATIPKTVDGSQNNKTTSNVENPKGSVNQSPDTPKKVLPPLPDILSIVIEKENPIRKGLPSELFINKTNDDAQLCEDEAFDMLDMKLLDIPIVDWIKTSHENEDTERVKAINAQIEVWDETCQLKERLKRIENPTQLKLKHFIAPWNTFLKFSFAQDSELLKLTLNDIAHYDEEILAKAIGPRILKLSNKEKSIEWDEKSYLKTLVVDLPCLTAQQLEKASFPFLFNFVPEKTVNEINIENLKEECLSFIISSKEILERFNVATLLSYILKNKTVEFLTDKQLFYYDFSALPEMEMFIKEIRKRIKKIPNDRFLHFSQFFTKYEWEALTVKQVANFDFIEHEKIRKSKEKTEGDLKESEETKSAFNLVFHWAREEKLLRKMTCNKIVELAPLLRQEQRGMLSETQILGINYTKFEKSKLEELFKIFFNDYGSIEKLIPKFSVIKIKLFASFFQSEHWKRITDAQLRRLEIKEIPEEAKKLAYKELFSDDNVRRVQWLNQEGLQLILPYMDPAFLQLLTNEQALAFDFNAIDEDKRKEVFKNIFHDKAKIQQLSPEKLNELSKYLYKDVYREFSEEQLLKTDLITSKEIFSSVYPTYEETTKERISKLSPDKLLRLCKFFGDSYWEWLTDEQIETTDLIEEENGKATFVLMYPEHNEKTEDRIGKLRSEKLLLWCKYFESYHWSYLTDAQIANTDFFDEENGKERFLAIYPRSETKRLHKIPSEKLVELSKYFEDLHWSNLSIEQIEAWDFIGKPNEKELFEKLYAKHQNKTEKLVQKLSVDKILKLQNYFDVDDWNLLTVEQVDKFNFIDTPEEEKWFRILYQSCYTNRKERMQSLSAEKLKKLCKYFDAYEKTLLTDEQRKIVDEQKKIVAEQEKALSSNK